MLDVGCWVLGVGCFSPRRFSALLLVFVKELTNHFFDGGLFHIEIGDGASGDAPDICQHKCDGIERIRDD